jgi:uncharacterized YccA/Bax inhibitor family protein
MAKFLEPKNPVLNDRNFSKARAEAVDYIPMTVTGAINKSYILFAILLGVSAISWTMPSMFLTITGAIGGLITVLVAVFKPKVSPIAAPVYAAFEGLFIGSISATYAAAYDGIVTNAAMLTLGTLFMMLTVYKLEIVKVTEKFRSGVIMATGAVLLTYVIGWIFSMFGVTIPYIHSGGIMGIGFSVVVIGIASLNLLLDFDSFEKGEEKQAPQYMEWFCAMGLMITIVWLYVEFLRLLSKLNRD